MAKEYLKLILHDSDKAVCVLSLLMLLLAETDLALEEKCGKENLVRLCSFSNSKVVFILLIEIVAVHVKLFAIYV